MDTNEKTVLTVQVIVNAPIKVVWKKWNTDEDITNWYFASDDWHAPMAHNDLSIGGKLLIRMEAKDASYSFDFGGIYDNIILNQYIEYHLDDGRKVKISFITDGEETVIIERFDLENINTIEQQQQGWHAILDNFKKYVEAN